MDANFAAKLAMLFDCAGVGDDQLRNVFTELSVAIARARPRSAKISAATEIKLLMRRKRSSRYALSWPFFA